MRLIIGYGLLWGIPFFLLWKLGKMIGNLFGPEDDSEQTTVWDAFVGICYVVSYIWVIGKGFFDLGRILLKPITG